MRNSRRVSRIGLRLGVLVGVALPIVALPLAAAPDDAASPPAEAKQPIEGFWTLAIERARLRPPTFHGALSISRRGADFAADMSVDESREPTHLPFPVTVAELTKDGVKLGMRSSTSTSDAVRLDLKFDGPDRLQGTAEWVGLKMTDPVVAERVVVRRFDPDTQSLPLPIEKDPSRVGLDPAALDRLIWEAARRNSASMVVVKDGRVVCARYFTARRPYSLQSITKTFASFAVPLLIEDGKLPADLDQPIAKWFPDWATDEAKQKITLRQVLTHTTGLASDGTSEMQRQKDFLAFAVASPLVSAPGTRQAYNNQAFELLSGVVEGAAHEPVRTYLKRRLFDPMGLTRWTWSRDGVGHTPTFGGINMDAMDLARFGWMVCSDGMLDGKRIIPQDWIRSIHVPGTTVQGFSGSALPGAQMDVSVGLVWWLARDRRDEVLTATAEGRARLAEYGFKASDKLSVLEGKKFGSLQAFDEAARELLKPDEDEQLRNLVELGVSPGHIESPTIGVFHNGTGGQMLMVWSKWNLVVVRQRQNPEVALSAADEGRDSFLDIDAFVRPCIR